MRPSHIRPSLKRLERLNAISALQQAIRLQPDTSAWHDPGEACFFSDQSPKALGAFQQALRLKPDDAGTYFWLGRNYVNMGRKSDAQAAYNQNVQKAIQRIRRTTGIEFRGHDLRRTAATHMTSAGIPRLTGDQRLLDARDGSSRGGTGAALDILEDDGEEFASARVAGQAHHRQVGHPFSFARRHIGNRDRLVLLEGLVDGMAQPRNSVRMEARSPGASPASGSSPAMGRIRACRM